MKQQRPVWYNPDTDAELCQLFYGNVEEACILPEWLPAFERRATSDASTSAGPSPCFDGSASPCTFPSPPVSPSPDFLTSHEEAISPARSPSPPTCFGGEEVLVNMASVGNQCNENHVERLGPNDDKSLHSLARKVFVGGISQDIHTDHQLLHIFNHFAPVKKAWLQWDRDQQRGNKRDRTNYSRSEQHRGFGFVIFQHAESVDQVIGNSNSCFITLPNGASLEVKRAVSNRNLPKTSPKAQRGKDSSWETEVAMSNTQNCQRMGATHEEKVSFGEAKWAAANSSRPCTPGPVPQQLAPCSSSTPHGRWNTPTSTFNREFGSSHPQKVLPNVPQFPSFASPQQPSPSQESAGTIHFVGKAPVQVLEVSTPFEPKQSSPSQFPSSAVSKYFQEFNRFVTKNPAEIELQLKKAMPVQYDD